jgi:ABC-2 type transport system ATP-binding protein
MFPFLFLKTTYTVLLETTEREKPHLFGALWGLLHLTAARWKFWAKVKPGLPKPEKKIGCIVESPALLSNFNALDCLNAHALLYGISDSKRMNELLDLVRLSGTGKKKTADFSLGMRQRLAIAQALVNEPEILILDEPTNGLDPHGIIEMRHLLAELTRTKNLTILVSSHILAELQQVATRFGIIKEGVLIDEFSRGELESKTKSIITIKVSDYSRALEIINNALDSAQFECTDAKIAIYGNSNFSIANKLLVQNNIDIEILSFSQSGLEEYYMSKVGGQSD